MLEHKLPPHGVIAKGVILPSDEEETLYDPSLQQDLAVKDFDLDHGRHSVGDTLDVAAIPDVVRAHTLEMALRKCYGDQI